MWNKLFPFNRGKALQLLEDQIQYMKVVGKLNYAYKLGIIKASLEEDTRLLIKLFRGLFGTAEPFYLAAREAESLRSAFEVLEKIQENEQVVKKLDLKGTKEFFDDFKENLVRFRTLIWVNIL